MYVGNIKIMSEFVASLGFVDIFLLAFNLGSFLIVNYFINEKLLDLRDRRKVLSERYNNGEIDSGMYQDKLFTVKLEVAGCLIDRFLLIALYVILSVGITVLQ